MVDKYVPCCTFWHSMGQPVKKVLFIHLYCNQTSNNFFLNKYNNYMNTYAGHCCKASVFNMIVWRYKYTVISRRVVMLMCKELESVGIQLGIPGPRYLWLKNRYRLRVKYHLVLCLLNKITLVSKSNMKHRDHSYQ